MTDQKITVSLTLLNAVMQYLGTRPYQESFQLIKALQEEAEPQIAKPEPE